MDQPVGEGKVPGCWVKLFGVFNHLQLCLFAEYPKVGDIAYRELVLAFYLLLLYQTPRHIGN
jgi:hypothetical protein